MSKVPLFITRYSLSKKNAIGVQTNLLLNEHAEWLHFFWASPEFFGRDARSVRIENIIFGRVAFFQGQSRVVKGLQRIGVGWWKNDILRPDCAEHLRRRYENRVSVVYVAPLDSRDAKRQRQLVNIFKVPFILHLWDFLDQYLCENEDLRWLSENAAKVFCLSQPMLSELAIVRPDAEALVFSRKASVVTASPPENNDLRIVLLGNLYSYRHGLDLLEYAVRRLIASGVNVTVSYVGPQTKALRTLNSSLVPRIRSLGFVRGDDQRDSLLSTFHIGFLPGPYRDPDEHMRSRYSIPSRLLDLLTTGLPIVGTIHRRSATGQFCEGLGIHEYAFCQTSEEVASALLKLRDKATWLEAAVNNRAAFNELLLDSQPEKLRSAMQNYCQ